MNLAVRTLMGLLFILGSDSQEELIPRVCFPGNWVSLPLLELFSELSFQSGGWGWDSWLPISISRHTQCWSIGRWWTEESQPGMQRALCSMVHASGAAEEATWRVKAASGLQCMQLVFLSGWEKIPSCFQGASSAVLVLLTTGILLSYSSSSAALFGFWSAHLQETCFTVLGD